jgi:hypothetical protein
MTSRPPHITEIPEITVREQENYPEIIEGDFTRTTQYHAVARFTDGSVYNAVDDTPAEAVLRLAQFWMRNQNL